MYEESEGDQNVEFKAGKTYSNLLEKSFLPDIDKQNIRLQQEVFGIELPGR